MTHSTLRKRAPRNHRNDLNLHPGPKPATISAILGYSKALRVVNAPPVGKIRVVLN